MKIRHGLFSLALLKRSLTLLAPTPTNISTNSEPDNEKNGTPASPAIAFAKRVLPVPGGPTNRTPLGILAPTEVNFSGYVFDDEKYWPIEKPTWTAAAYILAANALNGFNSAGDFFKKL